jgi:putative transposase
LVEEKKASLTQACRITQIDRKTYRHQSKKKKEDQMIEDFLLEKAKNNPTYGFQTLFGMLRNEGHPFNHKRVRRIYCDLKLNLKRKPRKRLAPRTAKKLVVPQIPNETWSLDYMSDALSSGRRFRTANVLDDHRRECLGIKVHFSLPSSTITSWLDQIAQEKGYPKKIRVDNGPENIAKHFKKWALKNNIEILYIQPGKPAQNAYIERFNRSYREAILDQYQFDHLQEVRKLTTEWIDHYNHERPHQALGMQPPILKKAA